MRRYLVPLAALALMLLVLAPGGASARTDCSAPCLGDVFMANMNVVQPGQTVVFTYKAIPTQVELLSATVELPGQVLLVKKGSTPFQVVEGRPTWTLHNLNKVTYFHFKVLVKKTAPRGRRQIVWLDTIATSGAWEQKGHHLGILYVRKH